MESSNQVVLVSPLHDPEGRLLNAVKQYGPKLKEIFGTFIKINVTSETNTDVINEIHNLNIYHEITSKILGQDYRQAINLGLSEENAFILLIDFDRSLHWAKTYPDELKNVADDLKHKSGFVIFNRSKRAFETHPEIQKSTEKVTNEIASLLAGQTVDIMSGAFGFDNSLAKKIIEKGKRDDYGLYAEILKIAIENKSEINIFEVEGLEWETPDQYKKEMDEVGFDAWLKSWESIAEWKERIAIIKDSAEVLLS